MDAIRTNEGVDEENDGDISMLDCNIYSEVTNSVLEVGKSSKSQDENCFGTVNIFH